MTPLQQCEFNLLKEFVRICEQLQLQYYLVCGSALGAVKYKGFIPWDDDVDVAMCREDYERFLAEAPGLLPEGLFLQNYRTDPAFPQIYSKLRNSNTTYIETAAANLKINHGIYIDIFPLDGYPENRISQAMLEMQKKIYRSILHSVYVGERSVKGKLLQWGCHKLGLTRHTDRVAARYEQAIKKYPTRENGILCNHGNWQGKLDYSPVCYFGQGTEAFFEGLKVVVPVAYSQYLTQKYGDYSVDLPLEQQKGHHYFQVCDCERPYTDYL